MLTGMPAATIGLIEAIRAASGQQTPHGFLDFVIDGESMLPAHTKRGFGDLVGPLWTSEPGRSLWPEKVLRLLGEAPGDAPGNRISVFVCGECGDLGCGAITVRLTVTDDQVIWSDWAYQNNYDEEIQEAGLDDLQPLVFDRRQYQAVLAAVIGQ